MKKDSIDRTDGFDHGRLQVVCCPPRWYHKYWDSIVKSYIEHCLNDGEYNRVTQAILLLSEESYSAPDYFENIINSMKSDGKEALAEKVIKYLTGKDESIDKMLDSLE